MKALIAELERAAEGSRELDARIMAVTREMPIDADQWLREWDGRIDVYQQTKVAAFHTSGAVSCYWDPREYSTSLDSALTLVPEGSYIRMTIGRDKKAWVWVECAEDQKVAYAIPALALCIAALRARQAMKDAA